MQIKRAMITGTNPYSFRSEEWAEIIGVKIVAPDGRDPRPAFQVLYKDGIEDFIAISDLGSYKIA